MSADRRQVLIENLREEPAIDVAAPTNRGVSAKFMAIVRDLIWELYPHRRRFTAIELDNDFDKDLGLDSLGRAELILRVDKAFKI
jgi:hypothetical protein